GLVELDDLRNEQDLPRNTGFIDRCFHAFIDDALVCGMLIDDHKAVLRLRDDVGLVHLRACSTKRPVDLVGGRLETCNAGIGGRVSNITGGLGGFRETGSSGTRRRKTTWPRR